MFEKRILKNGLRLVFEKMPQVKSVSVGIWIGTGSRNESSSNNGVSHFIEHMLFKGTEKRTAKEIAESIDSLGGQLNAFTGKECTCFYARTLDSHIDKAIEVLADMIFNSKLSTRDIKLEKRVVLEEIGMYEDSPEELSHEILTSITWENDALGFPILGTHNSVNAINRELIKQYMSKNYVASNTVVSVAGNFDTNHIVSLVEKHFGDWESGSSRVNFLKAKFSPNSIIREKDTEQVHLCLGLNAIEHGDERLYALIALNNVLGGGMSSRLFQRIRERKGLVYSIYSYPTSYKDAGLFTIYAGMNPVNIKEVLKLIMDEVRILCRKGLTNDEISKSKEQLKGNYILGLESTSSRMNSIGKSELILGKIYTPEEILAKIDSINKDMIEEVIENVFNTSSISMAVVGNISQDMDFEALIS